MWRDFILLRQIVALLRRININPAYFSLPILLSVLAAMFEGVYVGLLIPMLNGFLQKDYSFIATTPGLSRIISYLPASLTSTDRMLFGVLLTLFFIAALLKNVLRAGASVSMSFLTTRALHHLRKTVFSTYLTFGKLYFDRTNVGQHNTVLSQFTNNAMIPLLTIDKFMQSVFSLTVYFVIMLSISWKLTIIAIPLFIILHVSVRRLISRVHAISRSHAVQLSALGKKVVEILSVLPLVKAYGMEDAERKQYTHISDEVATLEYRKAAVQQVIRPFQETITLIAGALLFSGMLYLLVNEKTLTPSSFLVYFYIIINATNKFTALTSFRTDLAAANGPLQAVSAVFDLSDKNIIPEGKREFTGLKQNIECRHLSFSYPGSKEVLHDLNLTIDKGKITAIVGETGAGKTTLINLLLRSYDCPPKSLFLDGTDIREFTSSSILARTAIVSQETLLLHETLRYNLTYGQENVSDAQLKEIIERARLSDYLKQLPQGLDTLIGDRGVKLSGGEKQRVSIARALLKGADILILDEATSSLDSKTEALIQEAIDDAIKGKTAIVIAHRLATIQHADKIVVLDKGTCVEEGTLDALLAKKGLFYSYWQAQKFA